MKFLSGGGVGVRFDKLAAALHPARSIYAAATVDTTAAAVIDTRGNDDAAAAITFKYYISRVALNTSCSRSCYYLYTQRYDDHLCSSCVDDPKLYVLYINYYDITLVYTAYDVHCTAVRMRVCVCVRVYDSKRYRR